MDPILKIAVIVVTAALISYSIGFFVEQKKRVISRTVVAFLTIGLLLDAFSTVLMIYGSRNIPFTLHGLLGYSALLAMLVETILTWRFYLLNGDRTTTTKGLHLYTRAAYAWWVLAYIVGALLAVVSRSSA